MHTWTMTATTPLVAPPPADAAPVVAAANVVAMCSLCGEVRVSAVVAGNQTVDLAGDCPAEPSHIAPAMYAIRRAPDAER